MSFLYSSADHDHKAQSGTLRARVRALWGLSGWRGKLSGLSPEVLDLQALHRVRSRLISNRTAVINQLRGFLLDAANARHRVHQPQSSIWYSPRSGELRNMAGSGRGPWHLARSKALSVGLSNAHFKSLGLPSLIEVR
jgi:hypothetical protein